MSEVRRRGKARKKRPNDGKYDANKLTERYFLVLCVFATSRYSQEDSQDKFELIDTGMTTSNTIEVVWRPPAKNLERIKSYKLMMATNTGVVKEICEGKYTRFKVMGLRPNTQYIFCVKALFGDGSFLWSDSKSFRTK